MKTSSVTVIIPAYKAARTIGRAIDSILAQTVQPEEILVVDDGSPEEIRPALARYGGQVTLIRKANGGAASARNLGIDRARGQFIAFLDADDYWEPAKLECQLAIFDRHPEVALVSGNAYEEPPGQPRSIPPIAFPNLYEKVLRASGEAVLAAATQIWTGTMIVRRSALGDLRFVSGLEPAEDRDLWARIVARHPCYLLLEPLATAVLEPNSLSRSNVDVDCGNMLRVVRRNADVLGRRGLVHWEALTFRRWAAGHLGQGCPTAALKPAYNRFRRQPLSPEGWWILLKCAGLSLCARGQSPKLPTPNVK
jgi:glycosyltransferase involved in cell wall biosynthesis